MHLKHMLLSIVAASLIGLGYSVPASAEGYDPVTCEAAADGSLPVECLVSVYPPAPTPVDDCSTDNDGVLVPEASGFSYYKLVDGFYGGDLVPGIFNAWTGAIIASPSDGHYFPGGTQSVWTYEFTNQPCVVEQPPVNQTVTAAVIIDCSETIESGFLVFEPASPVDTLFSIEQHNGRKGGRIIENFMIPAGTQRYEFGQAEIDALNSARELNPGLPHFEVYITTPKGNGGSYYNLGFLLTTDPCVAVGIPPSPPTIGSITGPADPIPGAPATPVQPTSTSVAAVGQPSVPSAPAAMPTTMLPQTGAMFIFVLSVIAASLIGLGLICIMPQRRRRAAIA
jgi:hypothetical protein